MTPLFVVGVPRSGTTLTRGLLQALEGVYLPPDEFQLISAALSKKISRERLKGIIESSNFADHMRRRGLWPGNGFLDEASKLNDGPMILQLLILEIAKMEKVENLEYWGDKTPENLFHLDAIFATWPDAKVIHVLRDPRSTVLSMKSSWGRSLQRGSVIWRDGIQSIEQQKAGPYADQIFEVLYEELTRDPAETIRSLGQWLNVPFDTDALGNFQSEERWSAAKQPGIQHRGAEWKTVAQTRDIETIESICFEAMSSTAYSPIYATAAVQPAKFALLSSRVGDAWRVLTSYARERGWPAAISYKLRQWYSSGLN